MGWTGTSGEIDPGMIFRKMYCKNCGTRLKIKKNVTVVKKGDKGFSYHIGHGWAIGMSAYNSISYTYKCPKCHHEITYDEQCIVAKEQRKQKKKILDK